MVLKQLSSNENYSEGKRTECDTNKKRTQN